MKTTTRARISEAWDLAAEVFDDDKSLPFLISWTAHHAGVEYDAVVGWLAGEEDRRRRTVG